MAVSLGFHRTTLPCHKGVKHDSQGGGRPTIPTLFRLHLSSLIQCLCCFPEASTMEGPVFTSDSGLASLFLQAQAKSCLHSRLRLFSVFWAIPGCGWTSTHRLRARVLSQRTCTRPELVQQSRHQEGPLQDARGCPCAYTHATPKVQAAGPTPALFLADVGFPNIRTWELPQVQAPSLNNGSRSCGFHFRASASRHPASKFLYVPPQAPAVHLRCHLAKTDRGSHLSHRFLN